MSGKVYYIISGYIIIVCVDSILISIEFWFFEMSQTELGIKTGFV